MKRYRDVLNDLKATIDELEAKGYQLQPLHDIYEELEQRSSNITEIEEHIDAVRNEIIEPVNSELAQGRRISRVSLGIGILGFAAAIFGTIYPVYRENPNTRLYQTIGDSIKGTNTSIESQIQAMKDSHASLERMMQRVVVQSGAAPFFAEELKARDGEIDLGHGNKTIVLTGKDQKISLRLARVDRKKPTPGDDDTEVMVADFRVYINDRLVDEESLDQIVRVDSVWEKERLEGGRPRGTVRVTEEDKLIILDIHRFVVTRILSQDTLGRPIADSRTTAFLLQSN